MATAAAAAGVALQSQHHHHHHPDHARISSSRLLQAGSFLEESNGGGGGASGSRFSQKSTFGRLGLRRQAGDAHSRQEVVCCAVQGSSGGGRDSCYAGRDTRIIFPRNLRFGKLGLRQAGDAHSRRGVTCSALRGSNRGGKDSCDDGSAARKDFPRFEKLGLRQGGASHARQETVCCASNGGDGEASDGGAAFREKIEAFGEALSSGFPLWVAAACLAGMVRPAAFTWIQGQVQIIGVSITMLGMGMTMSLDDLKGALAMPRELVAGVVLQYTVMPAAGALISRFFSLPANYAAGLILVACCPGGTASNVVTYLARGNVALSVLMTAASTFMAVVMTPMLTSKLVGQYVAVDAGSLFFSTLQVVLLPVTVGVLMAHYLPGLVRRVSPLAPSVAVVTVAVICAGAISQSAVTIRQSGGQVLAAVVSLHVAGFLFGYLLSRVLGFEESTSRTISIEVGMQNSVLGVVLASKHFGSPLVAVPCAVSSVCHSIIGSALARFWRSQAPSSDDAVLS